MEDSLQVRNLRPSTPKTLEMSVFTLPPILKKLMNFGNVQVGTLSRRGIKPVKSTIKTTDQKSSEDIEID